MLTVGKHLAKYCFINDVFLRIYAPFFCRISISASFVAWYNSLCRPICPSVRPFSVYFFRVHERSRLTDPARLSHDHISHIFLCRRRIQAKENLPKRLSTSKSRTLTTMCHSLTKGMQFVYVRTCVKGDR